MANTLRKAAVEDVVEDLMDDPHRARDIIQKLHTRLLRETSNDVPTKPASDAAPKDWYFPNIDDDEEDLFDNMPV